jgi:hypothetical protein
MSVASGIQFYRFLAKSLTLLPATHHLALSVHISLCQARQKIHSHQVSNGYQGVVDVWRVKNVQQAQFGMIGTIRYVYNQLSLADSTECVKDLDYRSCT